MTRIMFVTNSLTGGGAERSINLVVNELAKRNFRLSLVTVNSSGRDFIEPICETFPIGREWRSGISQTFKALLRFLRVVRTWKPEIIVLNCDLPEFFGAFLTRDVRIICVEHVNRPWLGRQLLGRAVRYCLAKKGVIWIAVSDFLRIWPSQTRPKRVIANPITLDQSHEELDLRAQPSQDRITGITFIGRLAKQKRPDWALETGAATNLPVNVFGDGPLRKDLQATFNLSMVSFHGHVMNPWSKVEEGSVIVVPSEYEGDGLVVIEAMNARMPILLSDIAEFRRFGLPEHFYCSSVQEFSLRIQNFANSVSDLVVPRDLVNVALKPRQINVIGDSWVQLISEVQKSVSGSKI